MYIMLILCLVKILENYIIRYQNTINFVEMPLKISGKICFIVIVFPREVLIMSCFISIKGIPETRVEIGRSQFYTLC